MASLVAQAVKSLPAVWKTRVQSLGGEEPLEKEMATHSSILAWIIPWTENPGRLQFVNCKSRTRLGAIFLSLYFQGKISENSLYPQILHCTPKLTRCKLALKMFNEKNSQEVAIPE